ncbi:hypothetical protein ACRTAA_000385 [Clostridium perfringens]
MGIENLFLLGNNHSNTEFKRIEQILHEVKKYDVFDFITRVSALNLLLENQNKEVLLDFLVQATLTIKVDDNSNKMSPGKFKNIIRMVEDLSISRNVDPVETMFLENIMFFENYWVSQGINNFSAYNLQHLIETLVLNYKNFDEDFIIKSNKFIKTMLTISDNAANNLGYSLDTVKTTNERSINIPNRSKLETMCNAITIDTNYLKYNIDDLELFESLYSGLGEKLDNTIYNDNLKFFKKPFLKKGDKTIVLNIALLPAFIFYKIILLAKNYKCEEELIRYYNNICFNNTKIALNKLGHINLDMNQWSIKSKNMDNYKDAIFSVFNDKILVLKYICDDGKNYSNEDMFGIYHNQELNEVIDKRSKEIQKAFVNFGIDKENIFEVIIINSIGRMVGIAFNETLSDYGSIKLHTSELECIAINESNYPMFIPRYIKSKNKLANQMPNFLSELDYIELYVKHDYSFYLNDDLNMSETGLFMVGDYTIDYLIRAKMNTKYHMVKSYENDVYTKVLLNRDLREIYKDDTPRLKRVALLLEFNNSNIWVVSKEIKLLEEYEIYNSLIDCITYWLDELREILKSYNFNFKNLNIELNLIGNIKEYYIYKDLSNLKLEENLELKRSYDKLEIKLNDKSFSLFSSDTNIIEKKFILLILRSLTNEEFININKSFIDNIFQNKYKKKFISMEITSNPTVKPLIDKSIRKIRIEDENELLDFIGEKVLQKYDGTYGIIKEAERSKIANEIVGYLYNLLEKKIAELSSNNLIELICYDLEKIIFNLSLSNKKYNSEVLCYPERKSELISEFSELNKTSRALKFLVEYVAACPPKGAKKLGEWEYEKILAICFSIIDWAYKNDLFYYNIFNTPIERLKSGRVGMKQNEFEKLEFLNKNAMNEKLNLKEYPKNKNSILNNSELLNDAFLDEFNFSFDDFKNVIWFMIDFSDEEVKKVDKSEFIKLVDKEFETLNIYKIEKIIKKISLEERENYLKAPKGYRNEEIYPWRFNREFSFTRRPVILRENELIWGSRQLYHMLIFTMNSISEGTFKAKSKKLKILIGKVSNERGEDFNNSVYYKIKELDIQVFKKIKKINNKKIADISGNTLGDLDILYIIPKKKLIVVGEVKDFNFSKSPYEMDQEYKKMFLDTEKEKCFATKHKRRVDWVLNHIDDLKVEYGLKDYKWRVKSLFIVNEPIISNAFYDKGLKIITYSQLNRKILENI